MNEDERFQFLEGKIWALERLLGAALQTSGIRDQTLDKLIEQARDAYPATHDSEHPVGIGFDQTLEHVRDWTTRSPR